MPISVSNTAAITAAITAAVQAMLNGQKTDIDTSINAARDVVKADITAARANINTYTDNKGNTVINSINANTDTKTGAVTTAVNAKGVVKSIQRGVTSTTTTVTIAAVDPAKSFVNVSTAWQNNFGGGGVNAQQLAGRARLTSATALQVDTTSANSFVNWEVIEYF